MGYSWDKWKVNGINYMGKMEGSWDINRIYPPVSSNIATGNPRMEKK